jgi:hypothetical protein
MGSSQYIVPSAGEGANHRPDRLTREIETMEPPGSQVAAFKEP